MTTLYKQHVSNWDNCIACHLFQHRTRVVLARGRVPAPLLFIGEAPGASEDVIGTPFVGPAGKLLDRIIVEAGVSVPFAMTNLVACIPIDVAGLSKLTEPDKESIHACADRLQEFVNLCNPKAIITVGGIADKWFPKVVGLDHEFKYSTIIHPAAILRMNVMQQGLAVQRSIITVADTVEGL